MPPSRRSGIATQHYFLREFYHFCFGEYSVGNLLFLIALEDYKKNPTLEKMDYLYQEFVRRNSNQEPNIPNPVVVEIESRIKYVGGQVELHNEHCSGKKNTVSFRPPYDLFESAVSHVMMNLSDTWSRFQFTSCFAKKGLTWWLWKYSGVEYHKELPKLREIIRTMLSLGFDLPATIKSI